MNVVRIKYAMRRYAAKHEIEIPKGYTPASPVWGNGAKRLAWRITTHAHKRPDTALTATLREIVLPPSFGALVVRAAAGEVGTHESPSGSNDGPRVKAYQATTGAYRQPWCASFVAWCLRRAGYVGKLPSSPAWVPAWSAAAIRSSPAYFRRVSRLQLRRGDFVTLWGNGHIEIFVSWRIPFVSANCIGGNTSPVGQNANGGMVARTVRSAGEMTTCGRVAG